ncbi:M42 family peptidase [bacterium]|nr:MAG: M42 family peptidase [bacterium]
MEPLHRRIRSTGMNEASLEFLKKLTDAASPSYHEEDAAAVFHEHCATFADEVRTDLMGNVIAVLNPAAEFRVLLSGHIDEIGLIVSTISEEGQLYFKPIGDWDPAVLVGQRVWIRGQIPGVIARTPVHLLSEDERHKVCELYEMSIDIGVSTRETAEKLVEVGDEAVLHGSLLRLGENTVIARGLDNKSGAYVVAETLRRAKDRLRKDIGLYAVGAVQEEVGYRGAASAGFGIAPQIGIAVDVSHASDYQQAHSGHLARIALGKGPVIARGANVNPVVYRLLRKAAEDADRPFQLEAEGESSYTDAAALQTSGVGVATGLIGVPLRYMHTPCEMLRLDDLEACVDLLVNFCLALDPTIDLTPKRI